jgi:hypothetical protein
MKIGSFPEAESFVKCTWKPVWPQWMKARAVETET